jgi:hypothetical protein
MTKLRFWAVVANATLALATTVAVAKRVPPKPVVPVVADGIRYSAVGDGREQDVLATDTSTGRELWRAEVFHTHIDFWLEEDVQWVFITNLRLTDNSLFVRDEKARCYSVDLKTHRVRKASCDTLFRQ